MDFLSDDVVVGLNVRKNSNAESQSENEHWTAFLSSMKI